MRDRPTLEGRTVVLTRARAENAALAGALREHGAAVIELACVRTVPLDDTAELSAAIAGLVPADLLVITSRAGADAVAAVVPAAGLRVPVAAVGQATAERARARGIRVTFVADRAGAATLGRELPLPAGEVVLARSDAATPDLPAILRARGARVREVVAYRTVSGPIGDAAPVARALAGGRAVLVFASPSAVDGLLGAIAPELARRAEVVAIGPTTAGHVTRRLGIRPRIADRPDAASVFREIARPPEEVAS